MPHNVASDQGLHCLLTWFSIKIEWKRQNRLDASKITNGSRLIYIGGRVHQCTVGWCYNVLEHHLLRSNQKYSDHFVGPIPSCCITSCPFESHTDFDLFICYEVLPHIWILIWKRDSLHNSIKHFVWIMALFKPFPNCPIANQSFGIIKYTPNVWTLNQFCIGFLFSLSWLYLFYYTRAVDRLCRLWSVFLLSNLGPVVQSIDNLINPFSLRKAKIVYSFGLSECNRANEAIS